MGLASGIDWTIWSSGESGDARNSECARTLEKESSALSARRSDEVPTMCWSVALGSSCGTPNAETFFAADFLQLWCDFWATISLHLR